jgi:hypothetical protein
MKMILTTVATLLALSGGAANARTFHYTCTSGDERYAFTVNTDQRTAKLIVRAPTRTLATFRILKVSADCAKYGWNLSDDATFCTATQGVGTLEWRGMELDCDQADTE